MLLSCTSSVIALTVLFSSLSCVQSVSPDRRSGIFFSPSRTRIDPKLMSLYKRRVRRIQPDCFNKAESNFELQQAISKMVVDDDSYLTPSVTQHQNGHKLNHAGLCEEDDGPDNISPDTTIEERALCAFYYTENHNKTRLPQIIPEVRCACARPVSRQVLNRLPNIKCEAVYYDVAVITFDYACSTFEKTTERVSLACVPVMGIQSFSNIVIKTDEGIQASPPT